MPITLTDVAQVAGVSVATASRVLSGSDHPVNELTRQSVLVAAESLGYRPNLIARSLRTDRSYTIGIIVENVSETFTSSIERGILDYLSPLGYLGIILNTDYRAEMEAEAVQTLVSRAADGIIFVDTALHSPDEVIPHSGIANIYVNRRYKSTEERCVIPDNYRGARLATEHLLDLGHQQVAYIGGPDGWEASSERLAGYRDALLARGIPFDTNYVLQGDWQLSSGYAATQRLLDYPGRLSAIFASSDLMALGAIYAIVDAGLNVPHDVAVVGYDNRPFSALVRPAITTVCLPGYDMGQTAARLLLASIEGNENGPDIVPVCGRLIVRESCGGQSGTSSADCDLK